MLLENGNAVAGSYSCGKTTKKWLRFFTFRPLLAKTIEHVAAFPAPINETFLDSLYLLNPFRYSR